MRRKLGGYLIRTLPYLSTREAGAPVFSTPEAEGGVPAFWGGLGFGGGGGAEDGSAIKLYNFNEGCSMMSNANFTNCYPPTV